MYREAGGNIMAHWGAKLRGRCKHASEDGHRNKSD
eukprot:CAMPEP_0194766698 /NCGR_PEP_ID=MMETSP0323_2-20130528/32612_1 /TAXON_ID=2866 ORGANISM="Crypthecodinium cohnii, Strain Seligo" /NCGR_SAMPLE_ID=MMETSP0323_2 /ASSEMBLY_ACC=CAM_ASM_000346 /LENGTH=34 /DNA_ID= /DNA_START= /DNA_END= /DNA_ORIENTATION=